MGVGEIGPATNASPRPKSCEASMSAGGTCENNAARKSRSVRELMRINTMFSHCETTLTCSFWGRCVATTRNVPYLRPSPAAHTTRSIRAVTNGSSAVGGHTLCASSTTTSSGSRTARRCSRPNSASATSARSRGSLSDPVSSTSARVSASKSSIECSPGPAHSSHPSTPRFSMRIASRSASPVCTRPAEARTSSAP